MKLSRSFKRYVIIGVSVFIFEIGVILVAQQMGSSDVQAVGLSFWLGLGLSFILQKFVTFEDKRMNRKVVLPQIIAFSLLVLFNFLFTITFTNITSGQLPATLSRTFALAITTLWNFYLYKSRIFKYNSA